MQKETQPSLKVLTRDDPNMNIQNYIQVPPISNVSERGYNVLHFNTKNRHYSQNPSANKFIKELLKNNKVIAFDNDSATLKFAVEKSLQINNKGILLEFGFCSGTTLNFIAALAYNRAVYGFDSLRGLRENWRPNFPAHVFAYHDENKFPFVPLANTSLIIGWIEETLPVFKKQYLMDEEVAFIHIDSDSNEAANTIFNELDEYIKPDKTVVILDEGYNFSDKTRNDGHNEWLKHEFLATESFAKRKNYEIEYLAFNENHQQLVLIFKNKS